MTQGDPLPPPPPSDPYVPPVAVPPGTTGAPPVAGTPVPYQSGVPMNETNPEARQWGMFAHLASLAGFVIPFGHFLGPMIVWMVKKDQMPFVNDQGKESMNFQITVTIALFIALATICIGIGIFLAPLVGIAGAVMAIIAALKANEGIPYRYPFNIRFIK